MARTKEQENDKKINGDIKFFVMKIVNDGKQLSVRIPAKLVEALQIDPKEDEFMFIFDKKNLSLEGMLISKGTLEEEIEEEENGDIKQ